MTTKRILCILNQFNTIMVDVENRYITSTRYSVAYIDIIYYVRALQAIKAKIYCHLNKTNRARRRYSSEGKIVENILFPQLG